MQPYLPVLPVIARYPFIRATGKFLEREYGTFSEIFSSRRSVEREGIKLAVERLKAIAERRKAGRVGKAGDTGEKDESDKSDEEAVVPGIESHSLLCSSCERDCVDCEFLRKLDFSCDACCLCFENCYRHSTEYFDLKAKAKVSAVYYLTVRAMLSHLSPWFRRKFAVNEARIYRERMLEDLEDSRYDVLQFLASDLGVKAEFGENCRIRISSYLRGAVRIRDEKWRLLNRELERGWVLVSSRELIRLLEEFLREKLEEPLPVELPEYILEEVRKIQVKSEVERIDVSLPVRLECIPPCMKKILSDLQKGVNVPHTARFAITAFLLNIGMDVDSIVELFSSAPDFDEEKTRYQVEHIAGQRGKGSEYICPSCETMKTYHNCYADCKVLSPLTYYYRKVRKLGLRSKKEKGNGSADSKAKAKEVNTSD